MKQIAIAGIASLALIGYGPLMVSAIDFAARGAQGRRSTTMCSSPGARRVRPATQYGAVHVIDVEAASPRSSSRDRRRRSGEALLSV